MMMYTKIAGREAVVRQSMTTIDIDYNQPPQNRTALTVEGFLEMLTKWHWSYFEIRHVPHPRAQYMLWYTTDGTGIGIQTDALGNHQFFTHALCAHDWQLTGQGNCYASYRCSKCGSTRTHDSSG